MRSGRASMDSGPNICDWSCSKDHYPNYVSLHNEETYGLLIIYILSIYTSMYLQNIQISTMFIHVYIIYIIYNKYIYINKYNYFNLYSLNKWSAGV